jgi:16S rRNA (guanine1207-N2)-methyltransferase
VAALDLYEADARALQLARDNLAAWGAGVPLQFHWHDVAAGLPRRYDAIVCNPPFHAQGAGERVDLGRAFIVAAAAALSPGGRLWLVANRHLPYEAVLDASFGSTRVVAQHDGFKVIEAIAR